MSWKVRAGVLPALLRLAQLRRKLRRFSRSAIKAGGPHRLPV